LRSDIDPRNTVEQTESQKNYISFLEQNWFFAADFTKLLNVKIPLDVRKRQFIELADRFHKLLVYSTDRPDINDFYKSRETYLDWVLAWYDEQFATYEWKKKIVWDCDIGNNMRVLACKAFWLPARAVSWLPKNTLWWDNVISHARSEGFLPTSLNPLKGERVQTDVTATLSMYDPKVIATFPPFSMFSLLWLSDENVFPIQKSIENMTDIEKKRTLERYVLSQDQFEDWSFRDVVSKYLLDEFQKSEVKIQIQWKDVSDTQNQQIRDLIIQVVIYEVCLESWKQTYEWVKIDNSYIMSRLNWKPSATITDNSVWLNKSYMMIDQDFAQKLVASLAPEGIINFVWSKPITADLIASRLQNLWDKEKIPQHQDVIRTSKFTQAILDQQLKIEQLRESLSGEE